MAPSLTVAWTLILIGIAYGAVLGLGFASEGWLGGYGSWRRRLLRLGHIACFGMAGLNLAFAFSLGPQSGPGLVWASWLWVVAGVGMPLVCVLSAWRLGLRHGFALPVLSALAAAGLTLHGVA